jgi:membrane protein
MACRKEVEAVKQLFRRHYTWFTEKMDRDAVDSYAAQCSFWILIAFIPFTMFLLTLLQTVRIENTSLLFSAAELFPLPVKRTLLALLSEITPPSGLLSATAVLCIWSASNGTLALVKGLYSVFDVPNKRGYIRMRILAIFYTLLLALCLIASLVLLIFGKTLTERIGVVWHPFSGTASVFFRPFLVFILLWGFFGLMFLAVPRRQVGFRSAFIGAAFSAAGWELFSSFFSIFVENFSNYATLYGSLAAIVIWMMWLYFCMFILLIGGQVAMWLQHSSIVRDLRTLFKHRHSKGASRGRPNKR